MTPEEIAALGARRGEGESLRSWLQAGPWGQRVWMHFDALPGNRDRMAEEAYCPECRVFEQGRWRWYSRSAWDDPRQVVCPVHGLPLVRARHSPMRPWTIGYTPPAPAQLPALTHWLSRWIQHSPLRPDGRLAVRAKGLEDHLLWALTRRLTCSATVPAMLMQWRLWTEGWPVPAQPHAVDYQVGRLQYQTDRLAVIASVCQLHRQLLGHERVDWPALIVTPEAYRRIERCLGAHSAVAVSRLSRTAKPEPPAWGRGGT